MKTLQELTISSCLKTRVLGKNYICFKQIDSTQKEIWRRINQGNIVNGTVISANIQTAGIGTHGRIWHSTDNNIAFSFYYETNCNINKLNGLTTEIAETILEIFKDKYGIMLDIKLPNDIYANGKKLGGILTEAKVCGDVVKYLVIGIGINNSQLEFCGELENIATSVSKEFNIIVDVDEFICKFCNYMEMKLNNRINKGL